MFGDLEKTTRPTPATTVKRIICAFLIDETAFRAVARRAALAESVVERLNRALTLQQTEEIDQFFGFLHRRAPDLVPVCRWLVCGPKLSKGHTRVPTFGQLQRLIQLTRELRPELFGFLRQLLAVSVLAKVAGVPASGISCEPSTDYVEAPTMEPQHVPVAA